MFTGIIQEVGTVREIIRRESAMKLGIAAVEVLEGARPGDSIAVNGVCVTAVSISDGFFQADISPETIDRTTLGILAQGRRCNLERAIRAGEPFGGHLVSGHIDGIGEIMTVTAKGDSLLVKIKAPGKLMKYIASKGSVAVDGISLTPFDCSDDDFTVSVIPHTAKSTTLGGYTRGEKVNIECDILSKYIERLIDMKKVATDEEKEEKIDREYLRRTGFLI